MPPNRLLNTIYGGPLASAPESEFIRVGLCHLPLAFAWTKPTRISIWAGSTRRALIPLSHLNFTDSTWNNYTSWAKLKTSSSTQLSWNGCVETRMRGSAGAGTDYNVNDAAPSILAPATLFPAYFAYDAPDAGSTSYGSDYIGTSGSPNEYTGLSSGQQSSTTNAGLLVKQKNQAKYLNRVISPETTANIACRPMGWLCANPRSFR